MTTPFKNTFVQAGSDMRRGATLVASREGASKLINWWGHAMLVGAAVQGHQYVTHTPADTNTASSYLVWTALALAGAAAGYYTRGRAARVSQQPSQP